MPFPMTKDESRLAAAHEKIYLDIKEMLQKQKKDGQIEVYSVENCGMMNEKVTRDVEQLDDTSGYLTIVIVKEH